MGDESDFLKEIQNDFLQEASELLINTEHCYLELEKDPSNRPIIEEIFRCVHTVKGGGRSVGFDPLSSFAHKVENLLVKIKNNELLCNSKIVSILLKCNDRLSDYLSLLKRDITATMNTGDLETSIDACINKPKEEPEKPEPSYEAASYNIPTTSSDEFDPTPKKLGEILVEEGIVSERDLETALKKQGHKKLGDILIESGAADKRDIAEAIKKQEEYKKLAEKKEENFIRLPLAKIDSMLDCFGEQVILTSTLEYARHDITKNSDLINKTISQLNKIVYDLQQNALALRMLSLKNLFNRSQRIVRDVTQAMGKKIAFKTYGEDTELDKTIIDELSGMLTHLLRNSVDHGIETPKERLAAGKSEEGTIILNAYHQGGFFYIEIKDDGKGLDRKKIHSIAIAKGLIDKDRTMSDNEIDNLIFLSGFSTKEKATDISGRGVGMDVVKSTVTKLRGTMNFSSTPGKGSHFTIKLPLTLSIFNGTIFNVSEKKYIIPNSEIVEVINASVKDTRRINKAETVIDIKGEVMPLIDLKALLKHSNNGGDKKDDKIIVLVVSDHAKNYGVMVDDLLEQQRVVLKKLGKEVENIEVISGGTILGDGKVALILDVHKMVTMYQMWMT